MSAWTPLLVLIWLLCALVAFQQSKAEPNLSNHKLSGLIQWKYEKRPFCNAFTGCGKKRTAPSKSQQAQLLPSPYSLLKRAEVPDERGSLPYSADAGDYNALDYNHNSNNNNYKNYYGSSSSASNNNNNNNLLNNDDIGEGLSDLIDINAEPAVENVQQQIMSQAKIFEAIREASREIFRQRNKQKQLQDQLLRDQQDTIQQQNQQQQQHDQQQPLSPMQLLSKTNESDA